MKTFAEALKAVRVDADLSQAGLALASGLSLGVIHDYEQGRRSPSLGSAFQLAKALGVSVEVFRECFTDTPSDTKPSKQQSREKKSK